MTMTLVSTVTVGSGGAASIDFNSIPQTGTDLLVVFSLASGSTTTTPFGRINSDSATNYPYRRLRGDGSSATSNSFTAGSIVLGSAPGSDYTPSSGLFSNGRLYITNYTASSNKSISTDVVTEQNATTAEQILVAQSWNSSSAITSLSLLIGSSFAQYSTASLYTITKGSGDATVS